MVRMAVIGASLLVLVSCGPRAAPTPTPVLQSTIAAAVRATVKALPTLTPTPTPIPKLDRFEVIAIVRTFLAGHPYAECREAATKAEPTSFDLPQYSAGVWETSYRYSFSLLTLGRWQIDDTTRAVETLRGVC